MTENEQMPRLTQEWLRAADEMIADAQLLMKYDGAPRSIINRAYFAMVYGVRALLALENIDIERPQEIFIEFDRVYIKTQRLPKSMSQMLEDAFALRIENDYRRVVASDNRTAMRILADAKVFIGNTKDAVTELNPKAAPMQ